MECQVKENGTPENEACLTRQIDLNDIELSPLNDFNFKQRKLSVVRNPAKLKSIWKGPLRVIRLLILVALLPILFIAVPLYMRYQVFSGQLYPVGMSDMRLIDKKVSTTWCQRQILRSNATFNAFLVPSQPTIANELVPVSMTRHLLLDDDMKEYWGFYLLQGSVVTVSTCVRWPGASLVLIRGHKHLQECAYIGDDSSEELDELIEANGGKLDNDTIQRLLGNSTTNKPGNMIRQLAEIKFHKPRPHNHHHHISPNSAAEEERDHTDPKILKTILGELRSRQQKKKKRTSQNKHEHIVAIPQLVHRYRQTNVNEDEEKWLSFKDLEPHSADIETNLDNKADVVESQMNPKLKSNPIISKKEEYSTNVNSTDINNNANSNNTILHNQEKVSIEDETEESESTSSEIYDEILQKLMKLGNRGKSIIDRLKDVYSEHESESKNMENKTEITAQSPEKTDNDEATEEEIAMIRLDMLKEILTEILNDHKRKYGKGSVSRGKRQITLSPAMVAELNEHDEGGNTAIEEGFEPDGYADHHSKVNETTPNDMSNSEFWSSFSSSEEALLECKGLILNLPLTPNPECSKANTDSVHEKVALSNTITYRVPSNGYYFFVFNSENELQTNYIRVKFHLQKTVYDLTKGAITECKNSTENCTIPLSFFSGERVVLEVPLKDDDALWNEEFFVMSECEPRTAIYLVCVIAVPMFVVFLAFQ